MEMGQESLEIIYRHDWMSAYATLKLVNESTNIEIKHFTCYFKNKF
jgi:hypothetical protein